MRGLPRTILAGSTLRTWHERHAIGRARHGRVNAQPRGMQRSVGSAPVIHDDTTRSPTSRAPVMRPAEAKPFLFDRSALVALAREHARAYQSAAPFPHVVIDDFLPPDVLRPVLAEFPHAGGPSWERYDDPLQKKLGSRDEEALGPATRLLLQQFNSSAFVAFLEELTGIDGLVPDPWLEGGGLHQIVRGGLLKVHVDFNKHTDTRLDRRINALLYLNEDWQEAYGGHLELWTEDMLRCAKKVLPIFDRLVVFNTTDFANHGHPDPLACPENRSRKSIALYYYSNGRPASELRASHTTVFKRRPGEQVRRTISEVGESLLPPIVLDAIRRSGFRKGRR
jgi:hypothetical protein